MTAVEGALRAFAGLGSGCVSERESVSNEKNNDNYQLHHLWK